MLVLDWSSDHICMQVTSVQLESPKVFMGGEPTQRDPISVYHYSTQLETRWITGCVWSSVRCCWDVWIGAEVSLFNIKNKGKECI